MRSVWLRRTTAVATGNFAPLAALDAAVTASSFRRKPILYALLLAYGGIRERGD
ncbi:hypothetical protein ACWGNU_10690 [Paenibacillus lautus]